MTILSQPISKSELQTLAESLFGDMVKGVVDVRRGLLALDAELHSDLEALLVQDGSVAADLWGINLYPTLNDTDFVEFDSLINVKPAVGNRSRSVQDPQVREQILAVVSKWISA